MSVPDHVRSAAKAALVGLKRRRRETFLLRLERWWPDLLAGVAGAYDDPERVAVRLVEVAARAYADRPRDLHALDEERLLRPDRVQGPDQVGYAAYTERFSPDGTLAGLAGRIDHLRGLGVTYLHLMPLLLPREGDNDGGYAVAEYRAVRPDLGTVDDLRELATTLRGHGISLVVDLVLNHVAREHPWAVAARAGDPTYRDYFHLFADRELPDRYEETLPEVFPDFAPGSFTFDDELDAWVWTTFNSWQWDLNWANPAVLVELAQVVVDLANLGVEVLRLDAIAFLWKRWGTDSQNQPEVHAITQALRAMARMAAPATLFKAEAIVGPRDLVPYLGVGSHVGRVSDLAYHNSLMVQAWSMLATGDVRLARQALGALPPTPPSGTWITYLRCHDDIGWAIDDGDAAAVGVTGAGHRGFLADWYAGDFPGSWSEGLVFQHNPETGDRRISGTAASLAGLGPGRPDPDGAHARLFLAHALVAGWGGVPVIWSGDELALPNDPAWAQEPGHAGDNRWAHRPRVTDADLARRDDPGSDAARVYAGLAHLMRVRATLPQLHASAPVSVLPDGDDGVLAVVRGHASGAFVGLYNVTGEWRAFAHHRLVEVGVEHPYEALGGVVPQPGDDGLLWLPPYAAWWVVDASTS